MARPKKDYSIFKNGHRDDGTPFFDLVVDGRKHRLAARSKAEAEAEAAERYKAVIAERAAKAVAGKPSIKPGKGTLREAVALYMRSRKWAIYKPLTQTQRRSSLNIVMLTSASSGRHLLGESLLADWLQAPGGADTVGRIMAACGERIAAAHHRRVALDGFFGWLLGAQPDAAEARLALHVNVRAARNPCDGIKDPEPLPTKGKRRGYAAFADHQVEDWLHCYKDDPEKHRAIRMLLMTGARVSDLIRLNRSMLRTTASGSVLTYIPTKGDDSAYRDGPPLPAVVPLVPELAALIDEMPKDRFVFIHSGLGRPFKSVNSMSNTVRKWRRDAGLPEGLSAHSMRKAATHWWLRHHRELIPNNFALKTIFGWATDKELERYIKDFNRLAEAEGMLLKHSEVIAFREWQAQQAAAKLRVVA
jgi:integrase